MVTNLTLQYRKIKLLVLIFFILCFIFLDFKISYSQWQPDVRLTNDPAASWTGYSNSWSVAANGSIVHTVWRDNRDGDWEIYYKRSTDGGLNWESDIRLTNNVGNADFQSIAVSGTYVHVVWEDSRDGNREIYYKRSTDKGLSWGGDIRITNDINVSTQPSISVAGFFVHIVWCEDRDGNTEIYYKKSTDGGASWGTDIRITNEILDSFYPSVSASGSNVHIVWEDLRDGYNNGNYEIYYKRSTNCGLSWGVDTRLTNDTSISAKGSVCAIGLNVNVVWDDNREGIQEIYFKRSTDGGINWGSDTRLTNNPAEKSYANVTGSGQNVHVIWEDMRDGRNQVYYKRSTDFGASWGADTHLSLSASYAIGPTMAVSGTSVHVVWQDSRAGNYEIFYKRDPTGNISPTYTISGQVTYQDNGQPVNQGLVYALHYDRATSNITKVDSTTIQPDGYYTLPRVPQDTIDIMYYQNDEDILQFVPTYYRSAIDWQQADKIYPTENLTDINGQVYRINNNGSSNLFISGTCYSNNDQPIIPLGDVIIYAKIGNEFKNYGISNANGVYSASKLPDGNYTLYAYRIGFNSLTRNVALSGTNLDTINFYFGPPIGIQPINEKVPLKINLYQNYPNPFNPVTVISYQLVANSFTTLKIYDMIGKEVAVLVNSVVKPGTYEVEWDASNYSSGVYYYQLTTFTEQLTIIYTETKKMVLIK